MVPHPRWMTHLESIHHRIYDCDLSLHKNNITTINPPTTEQRHRLTNGQRVCTCQSKSRRRGGFVPSLVTITDRSAIDLDIFKGGGGGDFLLTHLFMDVVVMHLLWQENFDFNKFNNKFAVDKHIQFIYSYKVSKWLKGWDQLPLNTALIKLIWDYVEWCIWEIYIGSILF